MNSEVAIPKIIHYCWFGPSKMPKLAELCIASWRKYMPEYELRLWTEQEFDVNSIPFTREAYREGRYAFVSDYVRLWAVYKYGGVYLDTDVELKRSLAPLCDRGAWLGREQSERDYPPNLGLGFALPAKHWLSRAMLDYYQELMFPRSYKKKSQVTIVETLRPVLAPYGLEYRDKHQQIEDVHIYPSAYFAPKQYYTGRVRITGDTYSVHHYAASWVSPLQKWKNRFIALVGPRIGQWLINLKRGRVD